MKASSTLVLAAIATFGMTALPAHANEAPPSVRISYADLDLSTNEGQRTLYRRVAQAARAVCLNADPRALSQTSAARRCQNTAIAQALRDVKQSVFAAANVQR